MDKPQNKNKPRNNQRRRNNRGGNRSGDRSGGGGNRRRNNNRSSNKSFSPGKTLQKYDNLLDQHLIARRKYYEVHGRYLINQIDQRAYDKAINNFNRTLIELRNFEQKEMNRPNSPLPKKIDPYPVDDYYSQSNDLPFEAEEKPAFSDRFEDPHLLEKQTQDFSGDKEESQGSMEDYYQYKGITPPSEEVESENA